MNKALIGIGLVVIAGVVYGAWSLSGGAASQGGGTPLAIQAGDHILGNPDATTTLVEYSDFQCPACAAFAPVVKQVVAQSNGSVKLVYRHFPLTTIHKNALLAAEASEAAAGQGKFWEFADVLFAKQNEWSSLAEAEARAFFVREAAVLGVDAKLFEAALQSPEVQEKVAAAQKEAQMLGLSGTPTFYLNGARMTPPRTVEEFQNAVLGAAAQGTPQQ